MPRIRATIAAVLLTTGLVVANAPTASAAATCNAGRWFQMDASTRINLDWIFAPAYGGNLWCELRNGNYDNWGVVALQNMLRECYGQTQVALDGDFGPITRTALINAQTWEKATDPKDRNIVVDGVYGPQTKNAVLWPIYFTQPSDLSNNQACLDPGYPL